MFRNFIIFLSFLLLIPSSETRPQSVFDTVESINATMLDLAILRMRQDIIKYKLNKKTDKNKFYDLDFATASFNKKNDTINFYASMHLTDSAIKTKLSADFMCEAVLVNYTKNINIWGAGNPDSDLDFSAKNFYMQYFMPTSAPPLSYHKDLYKPVFRSINVNVEIIDNIDSSKIKARCSWNGDKNIINKGEIHNS